jgi:trimeric autotransporter adhesin
MKSRWITMLCLACFGLLSVQSARAQACRATNNSLNGLYGFTASEASKIAATTGTGTTSTGTTGASAIAYSKTELGGLLGGIAAGNQFGLTGVLNFDGAGHIMATSSPTGGPVLVVGNYNVNQDCTISMSLTDPFGTNTTATELAGVIVRRGAEIDLTSVSNVQSQTLSGTSTSSGSTSSTGSTATGSKTSGSGLTIKLVQALYRNGCSVGNLSGLYGFILNPIATQAPAASIGTTGTGTTSTTAWSQPSSVIGYLDFDGAGNIVAVPAMVNYSSSQTTFSTLDFTGTYTVNPDCSGTMTIGSSSASSTSSASQALTIGFVISPSTGSPSPDASSGSPDLSLSFANSDEAGWGYAVPQ